MKQGTSVGDALRMLKMIDVGLDNVCATAPKTVAAIGGRDAIKRACEMTCVGPVPRIEPELWSAMAAEHVERQKDARIQGHTVGSVQRAETADRRIGSSVRGGGLSR